MANARVGRKFYQLAGIQNVLQGAEFMRNKKTSTLLVGMALSLVLGLLASAQTNGPRAPSGLRIQSVSVFTAPQPVPAPPLPARPGSVPPAPLPPGSVDPRQGVEPMQPPPPNPPPVFTNHPPVFTNHAPVFSNHPPMRLAAGP